MVSSKDNLAALLESSKAACGVDPKNVMATLGMFAAVLNKEQVIFITADEQEYTLFTSVNKNLRYLKTLVTTQLGLSPHGYFVVH